MQTLALRVLGSGSISGLGKKTGQICLYEKPSVSDLESSSLAGFFALSGPICARALNPRISDGLSLRGHHYWPDKLTTPPSELPDFGNRVLQRHRRLGTGRHFNVNISLFRRSSLEPMASKDLAN